MTDNRAFSLFFSAFSSTSIRLVVRLGITSVEIPKTVLTIQDNAFKNCTKLVTIDIPKSVTSIGAAAFQNCSALEDAVIPKFVRKIGGSENIFDGAVRLTIRGVVGSYINTYADTYAIPFERLISTCALAQDSFDIPKGEAVILSVTDLWPGEEPVFTTEMSQPSLLERPHLRLQRRQPHGLRRQATAKLKSLQTARYR